MRLDKLNRWLVSLRFLGSRWQGLHRDWLCGPVVSKQPSPTPDPDRGFPFWRQYTKFEAIQVVVGNAVTSGSELDIE